MSSLGIIMILVAIFIIVNLDKLAWVMAGIYKFNTKGYESK
jgi:hypothetical protein